MELPKGWTETKLEEAVTILDNKRKPINSSERQKRIEGRVESELFPYYGATGKVGFIDDYLLDGEYVLLGEDGAPFLDIFREKAYIVSGKIWVNNHAHILKSKTSNKFLKHYLNQLNYKEFVTGTTRLKLNQASMKKIPIPLPPLLEQHRIVEKIEELFSELDDGVKQLQKAKEQIKIYRQAVLKAAFEGKFTKDIKLQSQQLGEFITSIKAGKSFKCEERLPAEKEVGIVKVSSVSWGEFDEKESKTCQDKSKIVKDYFINEGDFLFSRANTIELVGACVIVKDVNTTLMLSDKILRFNFKNIDKYYVLYFLRSPEGRKEIESLATGNQDSMRNISQSNIRKINIPFTEKIEEQRMIVSEIEKRFSVTDKLEETIDKNLQQAEAFRQSILKKTFEGKLVPQDINDEPAEKLLEKVKSLK